MLAALLLFADEKVPTQDPMGGLIGFAPVVLMLLALWFLIILPTQRREKKQREEIMTNLKKNDEVLTTSGIIGTVHNVKEGEDEFTLKVDDNCKMRMKKTSIAQILKKKDAETPKPS